MKFTSNWKKQKARISRVHARIADARNDFLHKSSTVIAQKHGMVAVEDLQVSKMSASAKGTVDEPGRSVRAKFGLNKSILDQGWFEFRRQLGYKLEWLGGELVLVDPKNTNRRCTVCGHTSADNRKTRSRFVCRQCGHAANADDNLAMNILAAGLTVSACGAGASAPAVNQEPAEEAA